MEFPRVQRVLIEFHQNLNHRRRFCFPLFISVILFQKNSQSQEHHKQITILLITMFGGLGADATAAAGGGGAAPAADAGGKLINLIDKIDKKECHARNENSNFPWSNLLIGDTRLGCKSAEDEQLILHFEFSEFVKVRRN